MNTFTTTRQKKSAERSRRAIWNIIFTGNADFRALIELTPFTIRSMINSVVQMPAKEKSIAFDDFIVYTRTSCLYRYSNLMVIDCVYSLR